MTTDTQPTPGAPARPDAAADAVDPSVVLFGGFADTPHDAYRQLLESCPVSRASGTLDPTETVYISGYEDVNWAVRHPEVFSSAGAVEIGQEQPLIPLQQDPPLHTSYRRLLNMPFTPKRIAQLEPDVRRLVTGLIDSFVDRGRCDFNDEFATPLPSTIFLRLMGLPQSDLPMFLQWRDNIVRPDVDPSDFEGAEEIRARTGKEIKAYFEAAIDAAHVDPGDGLLGELVHADFEGRRLTRDELLGISQLMLLGGLDTVTATLDCMIAYLARHPDRRRQLVEDPTIIPTAVEEMLRAETPVQVIARSVVEPVTVQGVDLKPGDPVMLVLGAANVDPQVFDDPHAVDFGRDAARHVAFGGGNHRCLGAHLARLELRVALEEFHRRIPDYRIADGEEVHFSPGIRQASTLPLAWGPAS
ncbi:MAG TPA: cytochrome P450 [Acidimicrobiales bacterium]|nr:cytochrome P450 [Acidimicrobiales bacterium]